MPSQSDISQQLIQALAITEPSLDTTIGSTIRSIFDVVAEVVAEAYADQYLLDYQYDVDSKSGADLDSFVETFGITRFPAKRATGQITFSRTSNATSNILIAAGTQVTTNDSPPIVFNTLTPVVLLAGTNLCNVPIQAQIGGSSGNVAAYSIVNCTSNQMGFSSVVNANACIGGVDAESDDQLRARFKATVFRSLTGTAQMFLATALQDPDVSQANVIGATNTYAETIQITSHTGTSSVTDFQYLYPNTSVFGSNIYSGDIFTPGTQYSIASGTLSAPTGLSIAHTTGGSFANATTVYYAITAVNAAGETTPSTGVSYLTTAGSQLLTPSWSAVPGAVSYNVYRYIGTSTPVYAFLANTINLSFADTGAGTASGSAPSTNTAVGPPVITVLDTVNVPDGVYELQYDYLPVSSRNNVSNNISNRIDVYANNSRAVEATQVTQWENTYVFNHNAGDPMCVTDFVRDDGTLPEVGNYFIPFAYSPVINPAVDGTYVIGANTYTLGVDFWHVNDITPFGLGPLSRSGVEWLSTANGAGTGASPAVPTNGETLNLDYTFNQIPLSIQTDIQTWRLVGTDVMVHQAKELYLNMYFGIILSSSSYSPSSIQSQIYTAVSNYISGTSFNQTIQVSQILAAVQGVPGVVAVRFLTSADSAVTIFGTYSTTVAAGSNTVAVSTFTGSGTLHVESAAGLPNSGTVVWTSATSSATAKITYTNTNLETNTLTGCDTISGSGTLATGDTLVVTSTAGSNFAIQSVNDNNDVLYTYATNVGGQIQRAIDVPLNESTLATLNNVYLSFMANNTFGAV